MEPYLSDIINSNKIPKIIRVIFVNLLCGFIILLVISIGTKSNSTLGIIFGIFLSISFLIIAIYLIIRIMNKTSKKQKEITLIITILFYSIIVIMNLMYALNYIPHKKYTNKNFNIETYTSAIDMDKDGIDDQTDILNNVKKYISTKPKYKSKYYGTGYPNDEYGVCTDVVVFGLKDAGYDIKELLNKHVKANRELYDIDIVDKNIDFRRVQNLKTYLDYNAISLTTDIYKISEWQGGDIVVFKRHIGIVSDKRNYKGISFVIHHANPYQKYYEEDILEYRNDLVGHYRIS